MTLRNRGSVLVGAGILLSRIAGLVRQRVLAYYLGLGDAADVFAAAFRVPNLLQNLFGEGALSASFIPSYSRLLGEGREEEARRLAGAVLSILSLVVAIIVTGGVLAAPTIANLLAPEWTGEKRLLMEQLIRILFPGAGLLVFSAWCLGVLNSHRRFLLSYAAPVVWNLAIIAAVLLAGSAGGMGRVVVWAAWGSVAGSLLQVAVQWPMVREVGGAIWYRSWVSVPDVGIVVATFLPALLSRGALQFVAFVDLYLAQFLGTSAVAVLAAAQVLYTLPVSLFGMSISAAELPEMSRERGDADAIAGSLRVRLDAATQRLAFYIAPSAVAFLFLGGVLAGAIYQSGKFTAADSQYVWVVLAGSATGLLASTLARLYASAFYSLRDTRTPLRAALIRVALATVLGAVAALLVPGWLGIDPKWGAVGLTATAGFSGHIEFLILRRGLCRRIGRFSLPQTELAKLWGAALLAGLVATGGRLLLGALAPLPMAAVVVPLFCATYLAATHTMDIPEAAVLTSRLVRRVRR
ncbi:MAG: murein biosynthesis integral membrane protein MurJ [Gemmatimonadetes bacterium]|nr:murein biosynthesis integral membrane protein MurJ [Gemmatimonadota bacterium]